jgi:Inner membrane component of T3SS, cytoplasmic domain
VNQLEEWRRIRDAATLPQFEAMYPWAFLVATPRRGTGDYTPLAKATEFRTVTHAPKAAASSITPTMGGSAALGERLVVVLRKAPSNPFPERVSIGRAPNCDVVIRDPSVSKLHGHFRDVEPDSAIFSDAKSANGSRIDGNPVEPGVSVRLQRQSIIVLGRVRLSLLSAADVFEWL